MRRKPKPGFLLVARREWRWLLHDRAALILIFGVPLFAFAVLAAVFSHPVIRELGVVIVDADRSETSRAFAEEVAASSGLSIVKRAGDLASAARAIRSGDAIGAVYVPADFERDLKAERRPQVVAFYNQQFLTAAGIASSGLGDSLNAAAKRAVVPAAPKASRIGSLVAETIVLVNPQRNYAQFLLRTLLPMVLHVIITLAAGYAVGSEFRRRSMRTWLACAGGNPIVALAGKRFGEVRVATLTLLTLTAFSGWRSSGVRAEQGQLPELKRVIAAYGDHVVMKETLAEALSALFEPSAASTAPNTSTGTPLEGPAADRAREALDHYNQAMERLKSGDWAGFGTELDAMRGLLEDLSRQSGGH